MKRQDFVISCMSPDAQVNATSKRTGFQHALDVENTHGGFYMWLRQNDTGRWFVLEYAVSTVVKHAVIMPVNSECLVVHFLFLPLSLFSNRDKSPR